MTRRLAALPLDDLRRMEQVLRDARNRGAQAEEVHRQVEEEVPAAAGVVRLLAEHQVPLLAWLTFLVTLLSVLIAMRQQRPITPEQVEEIIVRVDERLREGDADRPPKAEPVMPKVGRNDPCPCGSGKKFKRCHGAAR